MSTNEFHYGSRVTKAMMPYRIVRNSRLGLHSINFHPTDRRRPRLIKFAVRPATMFKFRFRIDEILINCQEFYTIRLI